MGISVGGDRNGVKSDINVTPLVDIVLVLLIIFLVLTPIKMRHITIEVPRELDQDVEVSTGPPPVTVLVRADATIKVTNGSEEIELANGGELARVVRPILEKKRTEKVVFVDFEDQVRYGDAVVIMDTLKGTGAEKVALKLRPKDKQPGSM